MLQSVLLNKADTPAVAAAKLHYRRPVTAGLGSLGALPTCLTEAA